MKRLFPVSWPELVKVNGYQKEKLEDINKWEDANPVNQAWYDGDGGELFE
jgi:hypothetical protein